MRGRNVPWIGRKFIEMVGLLRHRMRCRRHEAARVDCARQRPDVMFDESRSRHDAVLQDQLLSIYEQSG